jgi:hypothetical protein
MFSKVMQWCSTVFAAKPAFRWLVSLHYFSEAQSVVMGPFFTGKRG